MQSKLLLTLMTTLVHTLFRCDSICTNGSVTQSLSHVNFLKLKIRVISEVWHLTCERESLTISFFFLVSYIVISHIAGSDNMLFIFRKLFQEILMSFILKICVPILALLRLLHLYGLGGSSEPALFLWFWRYFSLKDQMWFYWVIKKTKTSGKLTGIFFRVSSLRSMKWCTIWKSYLSSSFFITL